MEGKVTALIHFHNWVYNDSRDEHRYTRTCLKCGIIQKRVWEGAGLLSGWGDWYIPMEYNYDFCRYCEYDGKCSDKPLDNRNEHCDNAIMAYYHYNDN